MVITEFFSFWPHHSACGITLWKKSYDQLSILKSRNATLPTKVSLVKAMVFQVVMYGLIVGL